MYRTFASLVIAMALFSVFPVDAQSRFFVEIKPGYSLGFGPGQDFFIDGKKDSTGSYTSKELIMVGNYGYDVGMKIGWNVNSDISLVIGAECLYGTRKVSDANSWDPDGSVLYVWESTYTWLDLIFSPGVRFQLPGTDFLSFFGGFGALFDLPLVYKKEWINSNPAMTYTGENNKTYDLGLGAYVELGAEYHLNDSMSITTGLTVNKISRSLVESKSTWVYEDGSSDSETYVYVDSPLINADDQTADDVANTTGTDGYYTYQKWIDDFSSIGIKLGLLIRL